MLVHLNIQNIVLIDHIALDIPAGFMVMTGETGAGKSIVLDALGLIRGDRANTGLIRSGANQASVTATFDTPNNHLARALITAQGLSTDGDIILRRTLTSDGKSRAFINDQTVSIQFLKIIATTLFDILGQFETGSLMDSSFHRDTLDQFGQLIPLRDTVTTAWETLQTARTALADHIDRTKRARADEEYIRTSLDELGALALDTGEEEKLLARKKLLNESAQIIEGLQTAVDKITGSDGADGKLVQAVRATERLRGKLPDDKIESWAATLDTAINLMRDTASDMEATATLGSDDDGSYGTMDQVEDRIYTLRAAARKFGCSVDGLADKIKLFESQLSQITTDTDQVQFLTQAAQAAEHHYQQKAGELSKKRILAGHDLDRAMTTELPPLKLEKAKFITDITSTVPGATGTNLVRFCVAMNPGSLPAPLDQVASGGELSRLMLAMKVVLTARATTHTTLIFDEIDTGVGGAVADAMGERLKRLSKNSQVLAITHAPQVASHADHHFVVAKQTIKNITTTTIQPLIDLNDRRDDIARMISGADVTDEARAAASKLLSKKVA